MKPEITPGVANIAFAVCSHFQLADFGVVRGGM
jgi:hypothetical protein